MNLGQNQVGNANSTGGALATGGTTATTGPDSGGSPSAAAGRGTVVGGASSAGGVTSTGGATQTGSAGQTTATGQAGAATSTGGTNPSGAGGQASLAEPRFTAIMRVPSLASTYADDNPTLTSDLLEIYFSSKNRPEGKGNVDVWVAKRSSADAAFGDPIPVLAVSTVGIDNSPAISADGLTIWVGFAPATDGLGGYDIMQATRASRSDDFGTPVLVNELSSADDDIPRPLGNHNLTMPFASRRAGGVYLTYFGTRVSATSPFGAVVQKSELVVDGYNASDAFLTDDGFTVYFARAIDGIGDIYVARRTSLGAPFGAAIPLTTVNTTFDDRDPWLSPDGKRLYFASDRHNTDHLLNIYEASLVSN